MKVTIYGWSTRSGRWVLPELAQEFQELGLWVVAVSSQLWQQWVVERTFAC
jgi:hypothetical protein